MSVKTKNTVKDVNKILKDPNKQDYITNFSAHKKRKGGNRGNGGTKQPTTKEMLIETRQILTDFIKEQRDFNKNISQRLTNIVDANGLKE